jgi:thymidine kinase
MSLEIILGPMFSGKSSYAISYIRRQQFIGKKVLVVKPRIDTRYSQDAVLISHNKEQLPCMLWDIKHPLNTSLPCFRESDCIVIEEAQFFLGLKNGITWLLRAHKKDIVLVGLDADAYQQKFGEVLDCIPWANHVVKLQALCCVCKDGTSAPFTKRNNSENNEQQICVGGQDMYEAVCLKHL